MFTRELAAHFFADFINAVAVDDAVGPGEIDVFKNAERVLFVRGKSLDAGQPLVVDDNDFTRFHVADEFGVNQVERGGFAGKHISTVGRAANGQRTETMRVARADQFLFRHDNQGIRAFDAAQRLHQRICHATHRRLREHHDDDFAVHGGLENETAIFKFIAERGGVRQIAVVRDGDLAACAVHRQRLGVAKIRGAGRRVARVADGAVADEVMQDFRVAEDLRHEAHAVMLVKLSLVAGDDAGAFLTAML